MTDSSVVGWDESSDHNQLSTLQLASLTAISERGNRVAAIQRITDSLEPLAEACQQSWPDTSSTQSAIEAAAERLEVTYSDKAKKMLRDVHAVEGVMQPSEWISLAEEMTRVVADTPTLFGRSGLRRMAEAVASVRDDFQKALVGMRVLAHGEMVGPGVGAAQSFVQNLNVAQPPYVLGRDPFTQPDQVPRVTRGLGPLIFTVGRVRCTGIQLTTASPTETVAHRLVTPVAWAPVEVNLDQEGGFITGSTELIQSVMHNLMAVLPPQNLQIRVIDPVQLGRNVDYMHRLGDQATVMIGNKAATTSGEVLKLLEELEDHITYVTQKYLQGEHESLTDYNAQAGEIAEPYRVVLMFDLLAAISRGNNYLDDEALMRLTKVAQAGRRCGVFLLVHNNGGFPERLCDALASLSIFNPGPVTWEWVAERMGVSGNVPRVFSGGVAQVDAHFELALNSAPSRPVSDEIINFAARDITTADTVKVMPEDLARSIARKASKEAKRSGTDWSFANPADSSTWWQRSSAEDIRAPFGRAGAQDVAELIFASDTRSNALVAGVPGSGKSIWLHAVIMALIMNYGPEELELYLVDFKEGVEFNQYAIEKLRHAKVVAIESDRDFGISVLENLDREIERRGELFKEVGGNDTNLASYRDSTGLPLPRVLLVMDEFQKLFERDDRIGSRAGELLDRIIRQGRAFGVHVLMASQTLSGNDGLRRHTLDQVPIRVALKSSSDDSRRILAEDNPDAALLNRPGEGIFNGQGGRRDANQRFQTVLWGSDNRQNILQQMHKQLLADNRGQDPWVFNGADRVPNHAVERLRHEPSSNRRLNLPLGMPFLIGQEATVRLGREPGANAMLVGDDVWQESLTLATFGVIDRVDVRLWLSGGEDDSVHDAIDAFERHDISVVRRRLIPSALTDLANEVWSRAQAQNYAGRPVLVVVPAAHRLREMDANDYANELAEPLSRVLADGPDVGIHLVMCFDKWSSVSRRLTSAQQREFGVRVAGRLTRDESLQMVDSDAATGLRPHQLLLDDPDHGLSTRVQRIEVLSSRQIANLLDGSASEQENDSESYVGQS